MANSKTTDCQHPSVYGSLCVVCGQEVVENNQNDEEYHSILHDNIHLKMNKSNREIDATKQVQGLQKSKQLVCILDLDQTILHCLTGKKDEDEEVFDFQLQHETYRIYFRPHLTNVLNTLNSIYTTHIYTMGTNEYCEKITNYLKAEMNFDVLSRWMGRDNNVLPKDEFHMKSILRFNCPIDLTVVLDDRLDVWKQQDNVIPILPYYYSLIGDIHGSDRFELHQSVVFRMDNHLIYVNRLLQYLHEAFYKEDENGNSITTSVPKLLKKRLNIFCNCFFVLSGFIPNNKNYIPIFHLIEKFGGTITETVNEKTTHCICMYEGSVINKDQFEDEEVPIPRDPSDDKQIAAFLLQKSELPIKITDKVKDAKKKCYMLPPEWVYLSCYSFYKLDETIYNYKNSLPLGSPFVRSKNSSIKVKEKNLKIAGERNRVNSISSISSGELDSFADNLEKDLE
eukprot:NODE_6_length_70510_cov_1.054395.p15 type:complete len:453 gc:universal NODE_6_length_70510_cov_1.054395:58484-59842(+)